MIISDESDEGFVAFKCIGDPLSLLNGWYLGFCYIFLYISFAYLKYFIKMKEETYWCYYSREKMLEVGQVIHLVGSIWCRNRRGVSEGRGRRVLWYKNGEETVSDKRKNGWSTVSNATGELKMGRLRRDGTTFLKLLF